MTAYVFFQLSQPNMRRTSSSVSLRAILYLTALSSLLVLHGAQAAASSRGPGFDSLRGEKKVPAIFIFGDSTVDAGTNTFLKEPAFLANFTPYGQTFFRRSTGRFTDGRLWVDRLAKYFGLPPLEAYLNPDVKDYTKGVAFASAGSGNFQSVKDTIATFLGGGNVNNVANMNEQLQHFRQAKTSLIGSLGKQATDKLLARSLFVVSTGSNDLTWGYALNSTMQERYSPDAFTSLMIDAVYNTTNFLLDAGARRIVLSALGPLGCLPGNAASNNGSCIENLNDWVKLFNSKMPALRERILFKHHYAQVVYTDQYDVVETFIKNGTAYGFSKGSVACCGLGEFNGQVGGCGAVDENGTAIYNLCSNDELDQYVFWDYAHPTDKAYGILADLFINSDSCIKPYNISQLCEH